MAITVTQCPIDGLLEIQPAVFGDARGYFLETWSERDFQKVGVDARFVQDNESRSRRGVLRGLHFQKERPQGKLVRCVEGEVFDVAVDLRLNSPTRGKWHAVVLSGLRHNLFWVPPGFAHGFLVMSENATFAYKCTDFYYPEDEGGILWNDPEIGVEWPNLGMVPLLSDKDTRQQSFREYVSKGGAR